MKSLKLALIGVTLSFSAIAQTGVPYGLPSQSDNWLSFGNVGSVVTSPGTYPNGSSVGFTFDSLRNLRVTCTGCSGGGGGGGGSGGPVTMVDGASINLGNLADAAYTGGSMASLTSIEKGIYVRLGTLLQSGGSVSVINFPGSQPVTGTFWQSTQPVSIASMPSTPVTGSFWQSTQPVSIATMPSTPVTGTFWQTTQPVSLSGVAQDTTLSGSQVSTSGATAATKSTSVGCNYNSTLPTLTTGQGAGCQSDSNGRQIVVTVPSSNNVPTYIQAVSSGGASTYTALNAAASTMTGNVKASGGQVFLVQVSDSFTSGVWLRLYSSATAPTVGSGTPVWRYYCPTSATVSFAFDLGLVVGTGISYTVTAGAGDADTTAITTAGSVSVNVAYK